MQLRSHILQRTTEPDACQDKYTLTPGTWVSIMDNQTAHLEKTPYNVLTRLNIMCNVKVAKKQRAIKRSRWQSEYHVRVSFDINRSVIKQKSPHFLQNAQWQHLKLPETIESTVAGERQRGQRLTDCYSRQFANVFQRPPILRSVHLRYSNQPSSTQTTRALVSSLQPWCFRCVTSIKRLSRISEVTQQDGDRVQLATMGQ